MTADKLLERILHPAPETERAKLVTPPWPDGLAPVREAVSASDTDPLPAADVLVVTYTAAEGHALADVLTPGLDTSGWVPYRNGWPAIKALIKGDRAPALTSDCAAVWTAVTVGGVRVVLVKSDLHPATDGVKLPMAVLWRQMIAQTGATLVLTTGTAGGVGAETLLGDVLVSRHVQWDCRETFASAPFAQASYEGPDAVGVDAWLTVAQDKLIPANAGNLPAAERAPVILTGPDASVVTTDFFGWDDVENHFGLRTVAPTARMVEMDDAALPLALTGSTEAPVWFSVRDASDPQIPHLATIADEDRDAGNIYIRYGYWTAVGSVLACWALIAHHAAGQQQAAA